MVQCFRYLLFFFRFKRTGSSPYRICGVGFVVPLLLIHFFAFGLNERARGANNQAQQSPEKDRYTVSSLQQLNQAHAEAAQANDLLSLSEAHLDLGLFYLDSDSLRESIDQLTHCLEISTENGFERQTARAHHLLGVNYDKLSLYAKALDHYFKSLAINESLNDLSAVADNFNGIGKVYQHTGDFDKGLNYLLRALEINENDERAALRNLLNIGVIHQKRGNYEEAIAYYKDALKIAESTDEKELEAILVGNIGSTMMQQGQLKLAMVYLQKSLELKEKNGDHRRTLHTLNDIAEARLLIGDAETARNIAEKVVRLAKEYEEGNQLRYGYFNLSRSYRKLGDYENAYSFLRRYEAVKDSLFGIEKAQLINRLQIGYETEKKDEAILLLQRESEIAASQKKIYLLTGLIVLILLGGLSIHQRLQSTRNRELLEKEKEVDRLKSSFFANISHEFRTPLSLILGPLETMLSENPDAARRYQLGMIKKNAARLLRLINQILELSKLESGRLRLKAKNADIMPVIKGVMGSFRSLADTREISLTLEAEEENIPLYFNQPQVETILINLIGNAFKFSEEGGRIVVKVEQKKNSGKPDELEIQVIDKGEGISPEDVAHIFDRFYQAGQAKASHYGGTGIGLALTKELVELHHGRITVESERGVGTKVSVCLPLGSSHLEGDQIVEEGDQLDTPTFENKELFVESDEALPAVKGQVDLEKPLVLIIDDNEDVRNYLRSILQDAFNLLEAADGKEGVEIAKMQVPDLVICDVMMPRMDGYEACRYLKQEEVTSHIPVILLTAKASVDSRLKGHETEADLYLCKPFVPKELLICVHNLIQSRKKLRERYNKQVVLKPRDIAINSADELFLERLLEVVGDNFEDEGFGVDEMSKAMALSRSQLHRKLQALTNESCSQFIRTYRLQRAMALLKKRHASISEIAFMVGFGSPSYFNRCFLKHYGRTPSAVVESEVDV